MAGKAVITGPHMENFKAVMNQLLEANGVIQISGEETLPEAVFEVLKDFEKSEAMVNRGKEALHRHRGAANRTVKMVCK